MGPADSVAWSLLLCVVFVGCARCVRTRMLSSHRHALRDEPGNREEMAGLMARRC